MHLRSLPAVPGRLAERLSRRSLLSGGAATMASSALVAVAEHGVLGQASATPAPQLRTFPIIASEFQWALMEDVSVRAWGYNGRMPGPEIRVREGDTVQVTLINNLPVPTTIHWHGVNLKPAMDGVAGLSQAPVEPGESFTYE